MATKSAALIKRRLPLLLFGCVAMLLYLCCYVILQANHQIHPSRNAQNELGNASEPVRLQTWTDRSSVPVCTSQERLNYIRRQYRRYNVTSAHSKLLVNDAKRVAYCYIEKCGSITMKAFMTALNNRSEHKTLKTDIHIPRNLKQLGLRFVKTTDVKTIADYKKFVVIRHPMDRLLSAYHDKLRTRKKANLRVVVNHKDGNRTQQSLYDALHLRNITEVKLERFVSAVVRGVEDKHWNPYSTHACDFSTLHFDDVIRIETFRHDMQPLLDYAHSSMDDVANVSEYNYRRKSTRANDVIVDDPTVEPKFLNDYRDVAKEDLRQLKNLYRDDLRLFGYDFDVDTLVASCSMTNERGETCC